MREIKKTSFKTKEVAEAIEFSNCHKNSIIVHCEHCNGELGIVYPFYNKSLTGCASVSLNAKCKKCGKYTFAYLKGEHK